MAERCPENSTEEEVTLSVGIDEEEELIDLDLPRVPEETEEGKEQGKTIVSEEGSEEISEKDSAEFSLKELAKSIGKSFEEGLAVGFVAKGVPGQARGKSK